VKLQPWEQPSWDRWFRRSEGGKIVARVVRDGERARQTEDEGLKPLWRWQVGAIREWVDTPEEGKEAADQELYRFFDIPQPGFDEQWALELAVEAANQSPCQKSQRGVVIWRPGFAGYTVGWNHQPAPFECDGSEHCRSNCGKLCVHAEAHALLQANEPLGGFSMLHVKTRFGKPYPSNQPSCWQCSRLILASGITTMWLLRRGPEYPHFPVLQSYTAEEFHRLTLRYCGLGRQHDQGTACDDPSAGEGPDGQVECAPGPE
jgi:deoxycytidylate deaminase